MFQISRIQTALASLIAFEQNPDSSGVQISSGLTTGEHVVNGFHPMLTFDNIYDLTHIEQTGSIVDKEAAFSAWLLKTLNTSIKKCVNEWRAMKLDKLSARTLIERHRLFRPQTVSVKSDVSVNFVGHEIVSTDSMSVAHQIERIGLQFDTNQTVRVFLFRDGDANPIKTVDVNYQGNGGVQWQAVTDWILFDGGKYFIGYDSSAIEGQAINGVQYDDHMSSGQAWKVGEHFSCMAFDSPVLSYPDGIGSMEIGNSFIIGGNVDEATVIWDARDVDYTVDDNKGINLEITTFCDYSSLIVGQADSFAYASSLRTAIDILRMFLHNPNSIINRNVSNAAEKRQLLVYEIDGEPNGRATGLLKDYNNALKGIMYDDTNVDPVCLTCQAKKGIKFKAMG